MEQKKTMKLKMHWHDIYLPVESDPFNREKVYFYKDGIMTAHYGGIWVKYDVYFYRWKRL